MTKCLASDENYDLRKVIPTKTKTEEHYDQKEVLPTTITYFKIIKFGVYFYFHACQIWKHISCFNQAYNSRFRTVESYIFWIYFDIGFEQKIKKTNYFTKFGYSNISWLKVTNISCRWKILSVKSKNILAKWRKFYSKKI